MAERFGGPEGYGSAGPENKKRKRNRAALSCSACKKAKIKCSRQIPCEACVRKNIADTCQWYSEDPAPQTQSYQSQRTAEALREHFESRLARVEAVLNISSASNSADVVHQAEEQLFADSQPRGRRTSLPCESTAPERASSLGAQSSTLDGLDIEQAAMSLEIMAGGDGTGAIQDVKPVFQDTSDAALNTFAANSILALDSAEFGFEDNPRLPLLAYFNRATMVEQVIQYLNYKDRCKEIIAYYFETLGWIFASVHKADFHRTYNAFWIHVERGERRFDPCWLACLCLVLAVVLQARPDLQQEDLVPSDLYALGRACLELHDWRRKPNYRVIQTLFMCLFYCNNESDLPAAMTYLAEGLRCCMTLGLHQLGDDPSVMPSPDPSCPPGSLRAREQAVRMWHEMVAQDWISLTLTKTPMIHQSAFTTAMPRPFTEEELDRESYNHQPSSSAPGNPSLIYVGKAATALFIKQAHDLGSVPSSSAEKEKHFEALKTLEAEYLERVGEYMCNGVLRPQILDDWRSHVATCGFAMRRCRLWRPYMVAGYTDPRFAYATSASREASLTILHQLKVLKELKAPTSGVWFLSRHALSAITTLYIDILYDIDTSADTLACEEKLVNLPYALDLFKALEKSKAESSRALGRKARLLVQALQDAKEARRQTRGSREDYSQVLQRIAAKVKQTPEDEAATASSSYFPRTATTITTGTSSSSTTTPLDVNWLDDPETRDFLGSLGLFDSTLGGDAAHGGGDAFPPALAFGEWDTAAGLQATLDRLEGPL